MNKHLLNILTLLLSSTAFLSCSAAFDMEMGGADFSNTFSLTISGTVADMEDMSPLEGIEISVVVNENVEYGESVFKMTTHSDKDGKYALRIDGFRSSVSCTVRAADLEGDYIPGTHSIPFISWNSDYTMKDNVFYINDCDFHLTRATASENSPRF